MRAFRTALASALLGAAFHAPLAHASDSDAPADSCNRSCLEGLLDDFVHAMLAHAPDKVPVTAGFRFKENDKVASLGATESWKTVSGIGTYRIAVADVTAGRAELITVLQLGDGHSLFSLRIQVRHGRIVAADSIFPGPGLSASDLSNSALGMFSGGAAVANQARPGFAQQLPASQRSSRTELATTVRSYYKAINSGKPDVAQFAEDCHRIENGVPTVNNPQGEFPVFSPEGRKLPNFFAMGCREQMNTGIWNTERVTDVEVPVMDESRGVGVATALFHHQGKGRCAQTVGYGRVCQKLPVPMTILLTEVFKVRGGKIGEIESVWYILPHKGAKGAQ